MVPVVQILDIPVPQRVERLADFLVLLDTQIPVEQVIAVPKISNDSIQPRLVDCDLRHPQMAEQLVEVPTVLSFALLQQQTAEQIIDIPVPRRRRGQVGLQDFLPEQSSLAFSGADHRIDSPVRARSGHGGLQGSHPGQSSTSFSGAQHEVQGFRPGQSSTSFSGAQHEVQGQGSTALRGAQHEVQGFRRDRVQRRFLELNTKFKDRVQQRFVELILSVIGHRFLRNVSLRGWPGLTPSWPRCPWRRRR